LAFAVEDGLSLVVAADTAPGTPTPAEFGPKTIPSVAGMVKLPLGSPLGSSLRPAAWSRSGRQQKSPEPQLPPLLRSRLRTCSLDRALQAGDVVVPGWFIVITGGRVGDFYD
jgi:hypothetical protein